MHEANKYIIIHLSLFFRSHEKYWNVFWIIFGSVLNIILRAVFDLLIKLIITIETGKRKISELHLNSSKKLFINGVFFNKKMTSSYVIWYDIETIISNARICVNSS